MGTRFLLLAITIVLFGGCYSKQDETDALNAAAKIHAQLQNGDFAGVYISAGPGFHQAMDEATFVSGMTQLFKENGAVRTITPVAYQSGVDSKAGKTYILLFDLDLVRTRVREKMVFTRSSSGQMELWDLVMDRIP